MGNRRSDLLCQPDGQVYCVNPMVRCTVSETEGQVDVSNRRSGLLCQTDGQVYCVGNRRSG